MPTFIFATQQSRRCEWVSFPSPHRIDPTPKSEYHLQFWTTRHYVSLLQFWTAHLISLDIFDKLIVHSFGQCHSVRSVYLGSSFCPFSVIIFNSWSDG
jgi:hypothetical protein